MEQGNYLNRETSWLEFNRRVLSEAFNRANPLLERVRFLSIFRSNLDEYFMKRVGGLKRQLQAQVPASGVQRLSPAEQLLRIRNFVFPMILEESKFIQSELVGALATEGIELLGWDSLDAEEKESLNAFFYKNYFPILTPLSVDEGHPFPFISNLSTSLGILMRSPGSEGEEFFARLKVPTGVPTWIVVPGKKGEVSIRLVSAYELISHNLGVLFPGMEILSVMAFRITRNADVERDEEDADDLLSMVAEELRERRFAEAVRLEHGPNPDQRILKILLEELELQPEDVYEYPIGVEYFHLSAVADLKKAKLHYPQWVPTLPPALMDQEGSIFESIRSNDILVHHPYESFTASVERFIRTASEDPNVLAIKMTLYRTGDDSPFIPYLIRAAEAGKQVACLVELQARFDEERNILVARALEKAGVHVVYGVVGLKTHCKTALVVRKEGRSVRSYVHIGTGNYHARTALSYTDFGFFTAKPDFTEDIINLFHYLTGRSLHWKFKKLLVAPISMRSSFLKMIEQEIAEVRKGGIGHVVVKVNNLEDPQIIEALYAASQAGVKIDLIVRSICCLRPQVPGLSDNIRVYSIVGRFLEHSRVFYFRAGAKNPELGDVFIGSADWMERNLTARVEAVVPIEEISLRKRLYDMLQTLLSDTKQLWELQADGAYVKRESPQGALSAQDLLMKSATKARTVFPMEEAVGTLGVKKEGRRLSFPPHYTPFPQ